MIKKTLYFGKAAYLSKKNEQLIIKYPSEEETEELKNLQSIPIEDIGIVIFDNPQITLSNALLSSLVDNNCAVITCDKSHLPSGLFMPLSGNQLQSKLFKEQLNATAPLNKQLWQQTVSAKIMNQAAVLRKHSKVSADNLIRLAKKVKSGDGENIEGRAAAYYWKNLFPGGLEFTRDRYGLPPNQLLNYGYAILRGVVARGLVASGLLPTLGIHHHNKYNPYCLADDIMEPYRPYVDDIVAELVYNGEDYEELTPSIKKQLLEIPAVIISIAGKKSPLMVGMQRTTASLSKCYSGEVRKIIYPVMYKDYIS
jgi:CRISP-associated protein Cas1